MPRPDPPDAVVELAEQRSRARAARDWPRADDLRARIEAAGWRVVDSGTDFRLAPAHEPDVVEAGRTRYGSPASVPSRVDEPDRSLATIVVVASSDDGGSLETIEAVLRHAPADTDALVVSHGDLDAATLPPAIEAIWTTSALSPGAALQAALRRALGSTLIVLEPDQRPSGDVVAPLAAALADPRVAIAGADGLRSADLRRYHPAGPGEVTAIGAGCYALRRRDAIERRPFDERLQLPGSVATWCSLVLRDEGPERPPRVALALDLPLERPTGANLPEAEPDPDDDHARKARRDAYRLMGRFRGRPYLSASEDELERLVEDGADRREQDDEADQQGHATEPKEPGRIARR